MVFGCVFLSESMGRLAKFQVIVAKLPTCRGKPIEGKLESSTKVLLVGNVG